MRRIFVTLIILLSSGSSAIYAEQAEKIYIVGVVPQFEVRKLYGIWRPILDLLEEKSGYKFKLRGSSSIPKFEQEFISGKFDFAYMNPYHMVMANEQAGYIPLVRDHGRKLYGVLVVHKDSGITDPAQLNGKTLAFPSPSALGASLQIRQELHEKFNIEFKAKYTKTHDAVYLNVLLGETAAGGGVQKTLNSQKKKYREMLRVIHKTTEVEPHPFSVLPNVPEDVRERVRDALLDMGQSEKGRKLLAKIPISKIGPASMDDYLILKTMGLDRYYVVPSNSENK